MRRRISRPFTLVNDRDHRSFPSTEQNIPMIHFLIIKSRGCMAEYKKKRWGKKNQQLHMTLVTFCISVYRFSYTVKAPVEERLQCDYDN